MAGNSGPDNFTHQTGIGKRLVGALLLDLGILVWMELQLEAPKLPQFDEKWLPSLDRRRQVRSVGEEVKITIIIALFTVEIDANPFVSNEIIRVQ